MRDLNSIGLWKTDIAANPNKSGAINMTGIEVAKDQLIQLYLMLFPFIVSEFAFRSDIQTWAKTILDEIDKKFKIFNTKHDTLVDQVQSHTHQGVQPGPGTTGPAFANFIKPSLSAWTSNPEDQQFKEGENLITSNSDFTTAINHRVPSKEPSSPGKIDVVEEYSKTVKFIPFDANNSSNQDANQYVHQ